MAKITKKQIEESYKLGRKVYEGKVSRKEATFSLTQEYGMNGDTAGIYINSIGNLLNGQILKRTLSLEAAEYFLIRIEKDYNQSKLKDALLAIDAHITYLEEKTNTRVIKLRELLGEYSLKLSYVFKNEEERKFEKKFKKSYDSTPEERLQRIKKSDKKPRSKKILTQYHVRNADIKAEILYRAKGICGFCKQKAPFITRKYSRPFLEHHHIIPLSEDGKDSLENSMALCPNCHREAHYGENWKEFRK